jgi:DNA-directed RNA polymerase specialized sigma24 family protein
MANEGDDLIPTRASLLGRLKDSKDQASWQEFFDTYSGLIFGVARKAGLSGDEAKVVLEGTMNSVAEHMPKFKYDPELGSFKSWLHQIIRLQIISRTIKRRPFTGGRGRENAAAEAEPSGKAVDQMWEAEWKTNLFNAAVTNVKRRLDPKKFQIYDLQVNKQWPPGKVAGAMGLSVDEAKAAKRDITEMVQAEVKRLEEKMV